MAKDKSFQLVLSFFVLILVVLSGVVATSLRNITRSTTSAEWVNHTHALISEVNASFGALRSAEASLRIFLQSGDPSAQADYREQFAEAAEHIEVAKALSRAVPAHLTELEQLEAQMVERSDFARTLLRTRAAGDTVTLNQLLADDDSAHRDRQIRKDAEHFNETQIKLLSDRDRQAFLQAQTARWTIWLGLALNLLLLLGATWLIRDDLNARRRAAALLSRTNEELEQLVRARTAELQTANAKLRAENLETRWSNQALEHQLRYNSLIINSIDEPVFVITKALNISRINPAVYRATGWDSVQLVDHPLGRFAHLSDSAAGANLARNLDLLVQCLESGSDLRDQAATLTTRAGPPIDVRLNLFPLRDRDRVVGAVVTFRLPRADQP